jgi:hypothetical protein
MPVWSYWTQYAGVDVERWIRKLDSKLVSLHMNDYGSLIVLCCSKN